MSSANRDATAGALWRLLAGLEAGVLGVLAMLAWLGVSAVWQRRSFWTSANLIASCFYGEGAIQSGFSRATISGLALYLLLYGSLGVLFAMSLRWPLPGLTMALVGIAFALCWYYVSFGVIWKKLAPLVTLLHAERPTLVGHVIYGGVLARIPHLVRAPFAKADTSRPSQA